MKFLLTSAAAAAILMATPASAFANCNMDDNFMRELGERNGERQLSTSVMRDFRELRDAAMTLSRYGQDDACEEIFDAMEDLADDPQKTNASLTANTGAAKTGNDRTSAYQSDEEASFETAVAIDEAKGRMRADQMIGAELRGRDNDDIGNISDIVFDMEGNPAYAVVSYGGLWGLPTDSSAVPFQMLRVSSEDENVYYVPMNERQLERAPRFEDGNFDWIENDQWRQSNDDYYNSMVDRT